MKKLKSNAVESDNLMPNSRSAIYQLRGHEKYEYKNLPVDYSLLRFTEHNKTARLSSALYIDNETNQLSEEFKYNMIYFFVFMISYLLILVVFTLLFFRSGSLSSSHFKVHLICQISILTMCISSIITLCKFRKSRFLIREMFLSICLVLNLYLILSDNRILSKITNSSQEVSNSLPLTLGIISSIVMIRYVLFDYFIYVFIIGILNSLLFITSHLAISGYESYQVLSEACVIFLFNLVQISDCYRCDFRIKQIFIRKEKEENNELSIIRKNESFLLSGINTEAEYVLSTCSLISSNLKKVSRVVIFKDMKKLLKESLVELDKIKHKLALGAFDNNKVELNPGIDDEDQAFIRENFMKIENSRPSSNRRSSMIQESIIQPSKYEMTEIESMLSTYGKSWSFNIFFVYETTGQSISIISKYLLSKWDIYTLLDISSESSDKYFHDLEKTYYNNPYHNACHASDVLHSLIFYITNSEIHKSLTSLDFFAVILAALGHDVGHPGLTNRYLISSKHDLAIQYNDFSVLENMHCSVTFGLGFKAESDIFSRFQFNEWAALRKIVIEMILETDMSQHFDVLAKFKTRAILLADLELGIIDDKCSVLAMGLKCADISHCAKDKEDHVRWSQLIMDEFFAQGDLEKENSMPVSMYCDRETTEINKIQIGFLKNICIPLFEIWFGYLGSETLNTCVLDQLRMNLSYWESKKKNRQATEVVKFDKLDFTKAKKRISHV